MTPKTTISKKTTKKTSSVKRKKKSKRKSNDSDTYDDSGIILIDDDLEIDTYSSLEGFFSYRRSTHLGEKDYGRGLSVIMLGS